MAEISPRGVLAVGVSILLLLIAAGQRFNTPPTNRSGTTFALFHVGMILYFSMLFAVWLSMIALLASGGAGLFRLQTGVFQLEFNGADKAILPFVAALLIAIAVNSNNKFIKDFEESARQFCVRLASIPLLAEQLGYELAHQAHFRVLSRGLRTKITDVISDNIGADAINFNDGSLSSRFTRAIALYWLFIEPHNSKASPDFPLNQSSRIGYAKIMKLGEDTVSQVNAHYATLMDLGAAHFNGARPIRQVEESIRKITQETSNFVCSLIARFVLLHFSRTRRLHRDGTGSQAWVSVATTNYLRLAHLDGPSSCSS